MESVLQLLGYLRGAATLMIMLTVLVAAHELGHFLFARWCGMKVDSFSVMMGGVRETDLSAYLRRPLVSGKLIWLLAALVSVITAFAGFGGSQSLFLLGLGALAIVLPSWVMTRLSALYHKTLVEGASVLVASWGAGLLVLGLATRFKDVTLAQIFTVLLVAASIGLLTLYYQPVAKKPDESTMGEGELEIDGKATPIHFRPLLARKDRRGTEFSMLLLPLGGFVSIHGAHPQADGSEVRIPGGFYSKSPIQRLLVLIAGPLFSVLFGVLILVGLFTTRGIEKPLDAPVIGAFVTDSPAEKAGLRPGDRIISVDGTAVRTWFDLLSSVRDKPGRPIILRYERQGKQAEASVIPVADKTPSPVVGPDLQPTGAPNRIQGRIGAVASMQLARLGLGEATTLAFVAPMKMGAKMLGLFAEPSRLKDEVGGIGTIAAVTNKAAEQGLVDVLMIAAMLSISLGFMNLLPVPPLDGGQMAVAFVELLRGGRRLSLSVQNSVMTVGFMLMLALIVSVLALDVRRFISPNDASKSAQSEGTRVPKQ